MTDDIRIELEKMLKNSGVDAEYVHRDFLYVVANHFAIWREARMSAEADKYLDENITLEDTVAFNKGIKIGRQFGAEDMKEQILKNAVDATVCGVGSVEGDIMKAAEYAVYSNVPNNNIGDRVKLIIIKED